MRLRQDDFDHSPSQSRLSLSHQGQYAVVGSRSCECLPHVQRR
ncbi:Uncharacterised protein [Vibrio cholerae]|nr:Uncharacterised protein [Vibrio cholerae]CSI31828.1 Uncharacterised protein [Vibrio cholerae]